MIHSLTDSCAPNDLPLFAWSKTQRIYTPATITEKEVMHRLGISLHLARTICEQADLGVRDE